jgi:hypothetical protein
MNFIISRTSQYFNENPPCEESFKKPLPSFHIRTCTEEEFNKRYSDREGLWRSEGTNHTVTEEGYIKRQEADKEEWCVNIKSIEELMSFHEKHGTLIIKRGYSSLVPEIEIYDDYRE